MADAFDRIIASCEKLFVELSKLRSMGTATTGKLRASHNTATNNGGSALATPLQQATADTPDLGLTSRRKSAKAYVLGDATTRTASILTNAGRSDIKLGMVGLTADPRDSGGGYKDAELMPVACTDRATLFTCDPFAEQPNLRYVALPNGSELAAAATRKEDLDKRCCVKIHAPFIQLGVQRFCAHEVFDERSLRRSILIGVGTSSFNAAMSTRDSRQWLNHNTNIVSVVDEEYRNQCAANSLGSKGMFQLIQTKGSSRNLMALLNTDGSVTKTWHVDTSDGNGNLNCSTSSEKSVGNSMSDPLQIGKAEAVNLQFGSFGISAWLNDKGGTSHTGSVDDLRAHSRETSDRYFSSFGNSPKSLGGAGSGGELYIWSLLFLRCGTLVSGDSFGSVQFWNSRHETHLQAHTYHIGDVNALATVHSQSKVFSAGSDGQVILYKVSKDGFGADKEVVTNEQLCMWVYVGYVRAQTQEVRALTMAVLNCREDALPEEKMVKIRRSEKSIEFSYHKWAHLGVPMLISGGGDTKLFAYSAREFTQFAPHNFCPAPQRPLINLARDSTGIGDSVMLVQFTSWLDVLLLTVQQTKSNRSNVRDGLPMALRGELWQVFLGMIVQVMADARTSELEETELSRYHSDVKRCDIAGICGYPGKNNKGELSEFPRKSVVLSSCLHMMPRQKSEGSAVPTLWAPGMDGNIEKYDFRDQETPMMNMIAGGAAASSFVTHHNELNMKLYMRIAPGLYLKELVVGELDRVYEIWKPFRNEGIDLTHNPEFTTCEFYMAYADCNVLMELTEIMLSGMVKELPGGYKTKYHAHGVEKPPIEIDAFYDWRCTQFSSSVHCLQSTAWGQAAFQREGNVTDVGFERGLWLDWTWAWLNEAI